MIFGIFWHDDTLFMQLISTSARSADECYVFINTLISSLKTANACSLHT